MNATFSRKENYLAIPSLDLDTGNQELEVRHTEFSLSSRFETGPNLRGLGGKSAIYMLSRQCQDYAKYSGAVVL